MDIKAGVAGLGLLTSRGKMNVLAINLDFGFSHLMHSFDS